METQALPRIFPACPPSFLPDRGEGKRSRHGNLSVTFRDAKNSGEKRKSAWKKKKEHPNSPSNAERKKSISEDPVRLAELSYPFLFFSSVRFSSSPFAYLCANGPSSLFQNPENWASARDQKGKGGVWRWVWKRGRGRAERSCAADNP